MIGSLEKRILIDLYKSSKGLQDKTVANRFALSVSYLLDFIDKFTSLGYISYDDLTIKIQDKGVKYLLSKKLVSLNEDIYSNIPDWMIGEILPINKPYIPREKKVNLDDIRIKGDFHN
jgi:hypothetical protein